MKLENDTEGRFAYENPTNNAVRAAMATLTKRNMAKNPQ